MACFVFESSSLGSGISLVLFKDLSCFKLFCTNCTFDRPLNKMADRDATQDFLPSSDIVK